MALQRLEKIVKTAESWYGISEGTREHANLVGMYNLINPLPRGYKLKVTDSWCAAYVSVVMAQCGYKFPFECGVFEMWKKLHAQGCQIIGRVPIPGELVFFKSSHVGIVRDWVSLNYLMPTIEGNSSDMVAHRQHYVYHDSILGFMSPFRYTNGELKEQINAGIWGDGNFAATALQYSGYNVKEVLNAN